MKVYKFGGGVLKSAKEIMLLRNILSPVKEQTVIVVSAIGKTTNALESILNNSFLNRNIADIEGFDELKAFHYQIIDELDIDNKSIVLLELNKMFDELSVSLASINIDNFPMEYDKIISFGERLSSVIVYNYLLEKNIEISFLDVRQLIKTDSSFRNAKVDWDISKQNISEAVGNTNTKFYITQGFIASDSYGNTTTLGREGSDFTASIFAWCLDASRVVFWKEVDGIYNADPTKTDDYVLLPELSYREAVEQAYYGAKILHPKTIKPLQNKKIAVEVRSFYLPDKKGTFIKDISEFSKDFYPSSPIFIIKENQILISFLTRDFSFIAEDNLSDIFMKLARYGIKVNMMQSSAVSFSVCVDYDIEKIPAFMNEMKKYFEIKYNDNMSLITIRHYTPEAVEKMTSGYNIKLSQISQHTARYVLVSE